MRRRLPMLLTVAAIAGVVFQPHAPGTPVPRVWGMACTPSIAKLATSGGWSVMCLGWSAPEFVAGDSAADVIVRSSEPRVGVPCERVHYYRVTFIGDPSPTSASFPFAGGSTRGRLALSPDQATVAGVADAYVTDVQTGTEEQAARGGVACVVDSTYHFTCPATGHLDEFCVTWLRRSRVGVPG